MKKNDYEITVKRVSTVGFNVEAENIQKARELAEQDAKNHDWASEDAEYIIGDDDAPEILKRIDWTTLRSQKTTLLNVITKLENEGNSQADDLDGILNLIDSIQDYAVDELGVPEMHVFDFELEEQRDASTPEENFARESAQKIFDELCESDGFHQDDEIPSKFIEETMADNYQSDIIKAEIREQILNDLKENPQAFQRDDNKNLVYDSDMREDYEGIATGYIRKEFRKKQENDI